MILYIVMLWDEEGGEKYMVSDFCMEDDESIYKYIMLIFLKGYINKRARIK